MQMAHVTGIKRPGRAVYMEYHVSDLMRASFGILYKKDSQLYLVNNNPGPSTKIEIHQPIAREIYKDVMKVIFNGDTDIKMDDLKTLRELSALEDNGCKHIIPLDFPYLSNLFKNSNYDQELIDHIETKVFEVLHLMNTDEEGVIFYQ
jgi:hypothetical protein